VERLHRADNSRDKNSGFMVCEINTRRCDGQYVRANCQTAATPRDAAALRTALVNHARSFAVYPVDKYFCRRNIARFAVELEEPQVNRSTCLLFGRSGEVGPELSKQLAEGLGMFVGTTDARILFAVPAQERQSCETNRIPESDFRRAGRAEGGEPPA
jgi:hypothetical protein